MAEEERVEQTAKMVMDEDEEESKARPRAMREELKKPEFQPIPLMEHSVDNPRGIPKAIFIVIFCIYMCIYIGKCRGICKDVSCRTNSEPNV